MKRLVSSLLAAVLLVGVAGSGTLFAQENNPRVIRIGSAYGGGYGKPYSTGTIGIVHARGLLEKEFEKDGIKIDWYFFKGAGPATNEAIANNTLDFAYEGDFPSIVGKAGGLKTRIIAAGSVRTDVFILVPNDSQIKSIKDLKGRKVGIFKGINSNLTFSRLLEANGLVEKDLRLYNFGTAEIEAALASKDIEAGVGGLRTRDLGLTKVLFSTTPAIKAIDPQKVPDDWKTAGQLLVIDDFAKKYPDIVKRVVKVYVEAAKWGSEDKNRSELFKLWSQNGTPYSLLKEQYGGKSGKHITTPLLDEFFVNHYRNGVAYSKENKYIRKPFDVDQWIDRSYLDAALKELKLEKYWPQYDAQGKKKK
ncbi:MAG: NitT/TauT family transport system substrate-binding [Geobacteraceae bacterium]|nr:MAG: NitT/TauT family transport system substrate-binding [Geobacteraceae bacterium]